MTIDEVKDKYSNIEDKIPSVWQTYRDAGLELHDDIYNMYDLINPTFISDNELIRVIALIGLNSDVDLTNHINPMFAFAGLYPRKMKVYDIKPEINIDGKFIQLKNKI